MGSGTLMELTTKVILNIIPDTTSPVFFQGLLKFDGHLLTPAVASHIVWVKCDTSDLTIKDFIGSWLAPQSPLTPDTSGQFNGRVVVGSYTHTDSPSNENSTIQFNRNSFFECPKGPPPTP